MNSTVLVGDFSDRDQELEGLVSMLSGTTDNKDKWVIEKRDPFVISRINRVGSKTFSSLGQIKDHLTDYYLNMSADSRDRAWPKKSDKVLTTWYGQKLTNAVPTKMDISLPSQFQIGDNVEIVTEGLEVIQAIVYSVTFAGNGVVSYTLAIPIAQTDNYALIDGVRGGMRAKGSNASAEDLMLIDLESIEPLIKRSLFHVVK